VGSTQSSQMIRKRSKDGWLAVCKLDML
jgi:hypothetical protein